MFLVALAAGAVTPARAGDFIKVASLPSHGLSISSSLGLVLLERLMDVLTMALFVVAFGSIATGLSKLQGVSTVIIIIILVPGSALMSHRVRTGVSNLIGRVLMYFPKGVQERGLSVINDLLSIWPTCLGTPRRLFWHLGLSGGAWAVEFSKLFLTLHFLSEPVPWAAVMFAYPASLLLGTFSMIPASEGVVGGALVWIMHRTTSASFSALTASAVVDRVLSYAPILVAWSGLGAIRQHSHVTSQADTTGRSSGERKL
jgi:uncharacterized protein (TIRG00374 family)